MEDYEDYYTKQMKVVKKKKWDYFLGVEYIVEEYVSTFKKKIERRELSPMKIYKLSKQELEAKKKELEMIRKRREGE